MQNYTEILSSTTLSDSLSQILNNDKTTLSLSSGTAFPTVNLQLGMPCFRTDEQKLYILTVVSPVTWKMVIDLSANLGKVANADLLDGIDSTGFALTGHNHDTAYAALGHNHNATYLGITAKAADADKLDGYDSTAFVRSVNGYGPDANGNSSVPIDLSSRLAKSGDTMTGHLYMGSGAVIYSSQSGAADNARNTGYRMNDGQDIGEMGRSNQYYDDLAANCNGILPTGNCAGTPYWTLPNLNWWTWGLGFNYCSNMGQYDGAGGTSYGNYAVPSTGYNYDGYYLAQDEIGGGEYHRWYRACNCNCNCGSYSNCNCGTTAFNCRTNCNCNCNCACCGCC
jgi:hypothetical protein